MKTMRSLAAAIAAALALPALAYQVTGPVVEVSDTKIVVMKGKDRWELARTPETKVTGELKKDAKVTIEYTMTAKSVEVKAEKGAKKAEKAKK
jgi:hypothetical protein